MIKRIFVEKKKEFNTESKKLINELKEIVKVEDVRILNRYDVSKIDEKTLLDSVNTIFSEPNLDNVYFDETLNLNPNDFTFCVRYLDGQYDQRADFASQCVEILSGKKYSIISSKVYSFSGEFSENEKNLIKKHLINLVDSQECSLDEYFEVKNDFKIDKKDYEIKNFINFTKQELKAFQNENGLAMTFDDLEFVQNHFITEKRNPTITEIKVLDTYWSDHCRHTTFMTKINNVTILDGKYNEVIKKAFDEYKESKKELNSKKDVTLMDIATICMKELRKKGLLDDLDVSEEINACSINVDVEVDGKVEKYLVMFKNETHNHPTEIEPFGGAATCLGGAIRDPLSGRSYVYQAMRVTGAGNPHTKLSDTISGKLTQKKITTTAAHGYSSYGNQIGLSTGLVSEVYHEDFIAKRMEVGAVIAAAPKENVIRQVPKVGDVVVLVGGKTGRDGCGGATGSSKEHNETSILTCSAEVQKGDAPTERKIQRLFRNENVSKMIKRCNDFGAGGVCVAIGELCESLDIFLDKVPKKYEGLDATDLAISESQERMAVVLDESDVLKFIEESNKENLESTVVAKVTDTGYMRMYFMNDLVVNLKREFIETNGVTQNTNVVVSSVSEENYFEKRLYTKEDKTFSQKLHKVMNNLNVCSQKGLVEMFDSSIGANSVFMPFGGKYQDTPSQSMVCKIPVMKNETDTSTVMSYGYNPYLSKWSPFLGAYYALIDSITKVSCVGVDFKSIRLTLQEYFEKLGTNEEKWGKPFSALLGAFFVQKNLQIPAIGGKDSMSGTFKDINVPPTLISFAVGVVDCKKAVSNEFKKANSKVILLKTKRNEDFTICFDSFKENLKQLNSLINEGKVLASYAVGLGGISEAVCKMSFGNKIGFEFDKNFNEDLFVPRYGDILIEVSEDIDGILVGETKYDFTLKLNDEKVNLEEILESFNSQLEPIFNTKTSFKNEKIEEISFVNTNFKTSKEKFASPKVFIPCFPGTNCEYDLERAFLRAGGNPHIEVFKNLKPNDINESIDAIVKNIKNSQIIMLPGGFSAGDEPDGSAKFIATVFRNEKIKEAIDEFLYVNDGLMLGICNGFQALIKLGLLPFGKITETKEDSPTLTYNDISRHQSKIVSTKIVSNKSPWLYQTKVGDIHQIPISHGEGKFICNEETFKTLVKNGQIATQYVDLNGNPTYDTKFNPNGSYFAVEGITSADGRIFGKMGHSERIGNCVMKNISESKTNQLIFESGVKYFK